MGKESAKISALKSGNIDKYQYLTDQEIIPSGREAALSMARFEYSPLGKALEKQTKTIQEESKKQVEALALPTLQNKPKYMPLPFEKTSDAIRAAWERTLDDEDKIDMDNLTWNGSRYVYVFGEYATIVVAQNF